MGSEMCIRDSFVSDINRARVLRVRSVMQPVSTDHFDGDVTPNSTLETLIKLSNGDTNRLYRVTDGDIVLGQLDMKDLVKALVPRAPTEPT